jgi:ABC-type multidrug transport system fused ATPase/permease subunit
LNNNKSIYFVLKRFIPQITTKKRKVLFGLLILTILSTIIDAMSIGAILPFLSAITNPEKLMNNSLIKPVIIFFNINSNDDLIKFMTIGIITITLLSALFRWTVIYLQTRISNSISSELCIKAYQRTLYQPYSVHISLNSSTIIAGVSKVNTILNYIISPVINLLTALFTIISICIGLIYLEPKITFGIFSLLFIIYYFIIRLTKKSLLKYGQKRNQESPKLTKAIQEGLGGIRDVLLDGTQEIYCEIYTKSDVPIKIANTYIQLIALTPGIIVQAIAITMIVILSFLLNTNNIGFINALPILGVIALGIQRMIPAFQTVYSSWSLMKSGVPTINDALYFLEQPLPKNIQNKDIQKMDFTKTISLNNVSFKYSSNNPNVFEKLNLIIDKGQKVGVIGITGSGKSTILDIIMGLLNPTQGYLEIDGVKIDDTNYRSWQKNIAHVPQSIYLTDSTIAENIAFGISRDKINNELLFKVAKQAKILETIDVMPEKFNTNVGERGIRLSGGQRQRIGIARALYKKANVIIFDEATSALDNETENEVMQAIDNLGDNLTIIIVAHRLTTLRNCDKIFEITTNNIIIHNNYKSIEKLK